MRYHPAEEERRMRATLGVIAAALVFASGCAQTDWIDRTLVTVDVTGSWYGTIGGVGFCYSLPSLKGGLSWTRPDGPLAPYSARSQR